MLKEQIDSDLKEAQKEKNAIVMGTLRMLKARIKNEEIAKQKEFDDQQVTDIIFSEVKRRKDSFDAYTQGNREDLAAKEQEEIQILHKYLPEQMSEEDVKQEAVKVVSENNFTAADFGKAMGILNARLKGKAQGSVISKILKEVLK